MTAAWMLYAALTGAALSAAAAAAERAAAGPRRRVPRRFAWLAALAATVAWPAAAWLAGPGGDARPLGVAGDGLGAYRLAPLAVPAALDGAARGADAWLLAAWAAASFVLLARLAASAVLVRRWRRAWPAAVVDGVRVRVAPDVGPAVVGLRPMELVVPPWVLALDAPERALVLRHEAEHRAAGDPYLLCAAALATALAPWHPALWYQARRLRLAVELDCDARVLGTDPRPAPYARLLVATAERGAGRGPRFAPAFLGLPGGPAPRSHLERRIAAMRPHAVPTSHRAAFAAAALAAIGVACAGEAPDRSTTGPRGAARVAVPTAAPAVVPSAVVPSAVVPSAVVPSAAPSPEPYFEFQVEEPASVAGMPRVTYPAALRASGTGGRVQAQFVVDTAGRMEPGSLKVLETTHPAFADAVRAGAPQWRFRPAQVGGRAVRQLVQLPMHFMPTRD